MAKRILSGEQARAALLRGVNQLAGPVAATLGPGGRLVAIESSHHLPPHVTKDGVTVAREIDLSDQAEQVGARLVREAASKTVQAVGDGTTTATVLAQAILTSAFRRIDLGKESPQAIRRELQADCAAAIEHLRAATITCADGDVARVATVSANGDATIGNLVAEAVTSVGPDGIVTIEESREYADHLEVTHGLVFSSGYLSPGFVAHPESSPRMECHLSSSRGVLVIITTQELRLLPDFVPIAEYAIYRRMPVLIIADDAGDECVGSYVTNVQGGAISACIVRIPKERMQMADWLIPDLRAITGAPYLTDDSGLSTQTIMQKDGREDEASWAKRAGRSYFGVVESATISKTQTILKALESRSGVIATHVQGLRDAIEASDVPAVKDALRRRLARLVAGVATIKVGGDTEAERAERRDLFEDAMFAGRAAMSGGVLPGGGVPLAVASLGASATLAYAMLEPARTILRNAGLDERNADLLRDGLGFNVRTAEPGHTLVPHDLYRAGILDPAPVVIEALKAAVSIACVLLSIDSIVTIIPEEKA